MEPLWKLAYLLEPAPLTLIFTAIAVTSGSAFRALNYGKEMERNRDFSEASITLDRSQALMIPIMSSFSLLLMFYLFSSVSQLLTAFTAIASVSSLYFCIWPYIAHVKSQFGLSDPFVSRCCSKPFTRIQGLLVLLCSGIVAGWLVSGHWILNNLLGISLCITFVSHVRLPNIKICAMLLGCLFLYDIFWVFYSERFFGANVMVSVATQQASNPVHTVANSLNLPGLQLITKKLELPVKIVFPRNLFGGMVPGSSAVDYMMLGLGDMKKEEEDSIDIINRDEDEEELKMENDVGKRVDNIRLSYSTNRRQVTEEEKQRAYRLATRHSSDLPSVLITMQPSHVYKFFLLRKRKKNKMRKVMSDRGVRASIHDSSLT
ncbi:hypothetical protein TEA_001898 [Camellia sinensis var. sinensis]|uniref:Signal peptide peptidase-like 1 n=1 Tax=Camellia sinensis var. sinensis TaxID=542762 RepID=A0A4S4D4G1_CAMSN|nr:hypothetical protein TEA_001898 [Camellia sinensis var. sinensis]